MKQYRIHVFFFYSKSLPCTFFSHQYQNNLKKGEYTVTTLSSVICLDRHPGQRLLQKYIIYPFIPFGYGREH